MRGIRVRDLREQPKHRSSLSALRDPHDSLAARWKRCLGIMARMSMMQQTYYAFEW